MKPETGGLSAFVPWLEHEILHRREPDGSFARTRTHSVHFYYLFPASRGLRSFPTRVRFSLRPASVKRGAMAIGKARRRAVDSPVISSRTGLRTDCGAGSHYPDDFLFPSVQGPYSVVHGPATAFRAAPSAAIAHASIVHGAMYSIRNSSGSPPLVVARLTLSKTDRTQKQYRNVARLSAVNSQRVAVLEGPQLYASSVNFHAHSGSHSQRQ